MTRCPNDCKTFNYSFRLFQGYTPDLLQFFADSNTNLTEQCRTMLDHWFNDDDDASLDNLSYILEGLDMIAAADAIKRFLEPADKMEDISE